MRIRQIKPGWWLDKELRRGLSADAREFFIGLWMLADDAGWLQWDVTRIAAELYPFGVDCEGGLFASDPIEARESAVSTWTAQLVALPGRAHLVILDCGHAQVPNLAQHQRVGGRPVFTVRDAHARDCARMRATKSHGRVGNGRERYVTVDGAQAPNEEPTTDGLKARLGDYAAVIANGATPEEALGTLEARPDYAVAVGSPAGQELLETIRKRDAARRAS